MKIKRSEVLRLEGAFSSLLEVRLEPSAAFKVASNAILANELAEKIRKTYKPVDGHEEYVKKRNEILSEFGSVEGGVTVPAARADEITKKLKSLADEHTDVIDEQEAYTEKFNKLLDVEAEIGFEKIKLEELQVDGIEPSKLVPLIQNGIISHGDKS
jgi:hypothetical protein